MFFFSFSAIIQYIIINLHINYFYFFSMNNGTVKFYDEIKGFGFIRDSKTSKEYFVHSSGLIDRIRDNDEVTFDLQEGRKGLNAVNVRRS